MKKNLFISLSLLILGLNRLHSQITITLSDIPMQYNATFLQDTTSFMSPGVAGTNQTWDYSGFTPSNSSTISINYLVNNPNPYFPGANSTPCNSSPSSSMCTYLNVNSTGISGIGYEMMITGWASIKNKFIPPVKSILFPATYGLYDSTEHVYTSSTAYVALQNGHDSTLTVSHTTRIIKIDAWGTIQMPFGTSYPALRLKTTQIRLDSNFVHTPGVGWSFDSENPITTTDEYEWYVPNYGKVAAASNYTNPPGSKWYFYFYDVSITTGLSNEKLRNHFSIQPNPTTDILTINNSSQAELTSVELIDMFGKTHKVVQSGSLEAITLNVSQLPNGVYTLKLNTNQGLVTKKFIKQ